MIIKLKVESLSEVYQNKKKTGFLRKYLVSDGAGGREVVTMYADAPEKLPSTGEVMVAPAGDFYFVR